VHAIKVKALLDALKRHEKQKMRPLLWADPQKLMRAGVAAVRNDEMGAFFFFFNPSYHTTHATQAERRVQESPRRQRHQRVARRPKVASREETRPPPVSGGSCP